MNFRVPAGLVVWFLCALVVGFRWFPEANAPVVAATVWTLTAAIFLLRWQSEVVRRWIHRLALTSLIRLHLFRFVGFYFFFLARHNRLPAAFAWPAGVGDVAVATGALLLLLAPAARKSRGLLFAWNLLGAIDMIGVVCNALRCGLRDWQAMAALRELPLSLLPTFLVPLILFSHFLIFHRIWRWGIQEAPPAVLPGKSVDR